MSATFFKPWRAIVLPGTFLLSLSLFAAPGAHGPNGEHLDTETSHQHAQLPRFESFTEQFELVGNLDTTALMLDIHYYSSNRPLAGAQVEVETAEFHAPAVFDQSSGQYRVTEPALLTALQQHKQHELVITVVADDESDLLIATLDTSEAEDIAVHEDEHHHAGVSLWWLLLTAAVAFTLGVLVAKRKGQAA